MTVGLQRNTTAGQAQSSRGRGCHGKLLGQHHRTSPIKIPRPHARKAVWPAPGAWVHACWRVRCCGAPPACATELGPHPQARGSPGGPIAPCTGCGCVRCCKCWRGCGARRRAQRSRGNDVCVMRGPWCVLVRGGACVSLRQQEKMAGGFRFEEVHDDDDLEETGGVRERPRRSKKKDF